MKVWIVMWDALRGGTGVVSVHASVASAYGAARKIMDTEDDGDWSPDPFDLKTARSLYWTSAALNSVYIQECEIVP